MALTIELLTNSYVTLETAEGYLAERLDASAWTLATETQRLQALITAFRQLETVTRWKGAKSDPYQATQWPRINVLDGGVYLPATAIPLRVQYAQIEQALSLLANMQTVTTTGAGGTPSTGLTTDPAASLRASLQRQGVRWISTGNVAETYATKSSSYLAILADECIRFIRPYLAYGGEIKETPQTALGYTYDITRPGEEEE